MWWGHGRAGARGAQQALCARFAATPQLVTGPEMLGASASLMQPGSWPIRGLRHPAERGTCGWYLFAGDYSPDADFFQPQHARHVLDVRPELGAYLGLPPGWGFVLAPGYEDVFQDDRILRPS